jgi:MFS superfamily sulfate permease-like transporter
MARRTTLTNFPAIDLIAFLLAIIYMQSVLTVAHHTSFLAHNLNAWTKSGPPQTVESPAVALLLIGILLSVYSWYKTKKAPSVLIVISLTIFATASIFWLSGLRTNFYF